MEINHVISFVFALFALAMLVLIWYNMKAESRKQKAESRKQKAESRNTITI
jgi:uncharacterized membrane protein